MISMEIEHRVGWGSRTVTITGLTTNDNGSDTRNSRRPPRFCNGTLIWRASSVTLWARKDQICQQA